MGINQEAADKLRPGDRIDVLNQSGWSGWGTVTGHAEDGRVIITRDDGPCWHVYPRCIEGIIYSPNNLNAAMYPVPAHLESILSEDDKVLFRAGFYDSELRPTSVARQHLDAMLFQTAKAEMVAKAKEVIEEAKSKK